MVLLIFGGILLLTGIIIFIALTRAGEDRLFPAWTGTIFMGLGLLIMICSGFTSISSGHVGVQTVLGSVQPGALREGFNFKSPLALIVPMSVRSESVTMSEDNDSAVESLSADGLTMVLDITIVSVLNPDDAPWVYQNLGKGYIETIILPSARQAVREATSEFTSQEAYASKRSEYQNRMGEVFEKSLRSTLSAYRDLDHLPVQVSILVRNIDPPLSVKAAIEAKLQAQQEAQKMEFVLQRERQEADRKKIEAEGISEYQRIINQNLTDRLLQFRGIEATEKLAESPNSKVIVVGGGEGGLPLILNSP